MMKRTAAALAVVALCGYVAVQHQAEVPTPRQAAISGSAKAPPTTAVGSLPAPFQVGTGKPGEAVQAYIAMGTPGAAFDAFELIDRCIRHERYRTGESATHCDGISQDMRSNAGKLLALAADSNIPGAPTEVLRALMAAADTFKDDPRFVEAASYVVSKLEENAQRDREAISSLGKLYMHSNAITGKRDPEKALMYYTAMTELVHAPGEDGVKKIVLASLVAELTPEQVQRAQAAGVQLARNCDCKG
jgi:hypothetical protein